MIVDLPEPVPSGTMIAASMRLNLAVRLALEPVVAVVREAVEKANVWIVGSTPAPRSLSEHSS